MTARKRTLDTERDDAQRGVVRGGSKRGVDIRGAVLLVERADEHGGDGLIDMHLDSMRRRGLSPATVRARRGVLNRLARWLDAPPVGATHANVADFLLARRRGLVGRGQPLTDDSIRGEIAHLRAYFSWLVRYEYRTDDPTLRVEIPKKEPQRVEAIPDAELIEALSRADPDDRAILALSAYAGLRAAEIAALDWRDIDTRRRRITVHRGKGGRKRSVDLADSLLVILEELPHRTGVVIRRHDGEAGPNQPYTISHRASRILGGRRTGYTLHQLRHRFATVAYAGTHDIDAVQKLLGHSSPAITSIYVDTMADATRAAVDAADNLQSIPIQSIPSNRTYRRTTP